METAQNKSFSCTPGYINTHFNVDEGWILHPFFESNKLVSASLTVNKCWSRTSYGLVRWDITHKPKIFFANISKKIMKIYLEIAACMEDVGACFVVKFLG